MVIVDARGKQCPIPVVEAKKALEGLKEGDFVKVWVDNEIAVQNLAKLAEQKLCAMEYKKTGDGEYEVVITPGELSAAADVLLEVEMSDDEAFYRKKNKLVVISSDQMGSGAEELGKILVKGFIYALTEQDVPPDTILFYNKGASLTCEGSDSLEDLRLMESQGVTVMTCGTCLDYYGLKEKLAVGNVTNMYAIAQMMTEADLIIKP